MCNSPYSASKGAADLIALSYYATHGLDLVITRCSNNYGRYQNYEKFIPTIIKSALNGESIPIYGNGLNSREWIHVSDHCRGIAAVTARGAPGNIYNIGSGLVMNNLELTYSILDYMQIPQNQVIHVEDRKGHDFRYALNSAKIRSDLGWHPLKKFDDAIAETVEYYKIMSDTKSI